MAAGALILLAAIVIGITQLSGGDSGGGGNPSPNRVQGQPSSQSDSQSSNKAPRKAKPVVRSKVTVVVLNGTTVPGLAATTADKVEQAGYIRGPDANNADQQVQATSVLYGPGQKAAGRDVAKLLNVRSVRALDAGTQSLAGANAGVVVIVGADRTS